MNLIIDLQYFPPVNFYVISNDFSNIVFEQYEFYQKMSFRNRCQIAGAEGVINLSVPLEKGRDQRTLVKDVRIADRQPWQGQHWKTIVSCYSRSPWFEFYRDELEGLYKTRFDFLVDWNRSCYEWSLRMLRLPVVVSLTESYRKHYASVEAADWRGKIVPKNRAAGVGAPATKAGMPAAEGTGDGLDGNPKYVRYRQVFEERTGFIAGLSILDLLFCEGKEALRYIRS